MPRPAADPTIVQEKILNATESQLRRYGPEKLTVGDIARECGMSHPNLYRFFTCKNEMLGAVTRRWLGGVEEDLTRIAEGPGTAAERIEAFMLTLHRNKRRKIEGDPELFKVYGSLIGGNPDALCQHIARLCDIAASIVQDGIRRGEFPEGTDVAATVRAFREATAAFTNPHLLPEVLAGGQPEERLLIIVRTLLAGVAAGAMRSQPPSRERDT
jgi:AcrR family transcriptional regulator